MGTDRAEVTPETPLVAFCNEAKYTQKGRKEKSLAECFEDMTVEDLCGFTEDKLMAFVERKGGPDGLVPAWLEKHALDGYLKSADTKKAKTGGDEGSSASPGQRVVFLPLLLPDPNWQ